MKTEIQNILQNAMKQAKHGMECTHSLMLKFANDTSIDRWLEAKKTFNRHYRIACYARNRLAQ